MGAAEAAITVVRGFRRSYNAGSGRVTSASIAIVFPSLHALAHELHLLFPTLAATAYERVKTQHRALTHREIAIFASGNERRDFTASTPRFFHDFAGAD